MLQTQEYTSQIVTSLDGQPLAAIIDYNTYQLLEHIISELHLAQQSQLDTEVLRKQISLLQFTLHGYRIGVEMDANPSSVVTHAELKRQLAEKKASMEKQHVAA
jgi:hypothetical protein